MAYIETSCGHRATHSYGTINMFLLSDRGYPFWARRIKFGKAAPCNVTIGQSSTLANHTVLNTELRYYQFVFNEILRHQSIQTAPLLPNKSFMFGVNESYLALWIDWYFLNKSNLYDYALCWTMAERRKRDMGFLVGPTRSNITVKIFPWNTIIELTVKPDRSFVISFSIL